MVSSGWHRIVCVDPESPSLKEQVPVRYIKPRTDILTRSRYVFYDRTTGSPTGREPYGDADSIVVVGVTPHHGGWESQPQGEGNQDSVACGDIGGMRNAES